MTFWHGIDFFDRNHYLDADGVRRRRLLPPELPRAAAELPKLVELLKFSVHPDTLLSSRNRWFEPAFPQNILVRDSASGHQRIRDWLRQRRSIQRKDE
jgi:hypothetical protein